MGIAHGLGGEDGGGWRIGRLVERCRLDGEHVWSLCELNDPIVEILVGEFNRCGEICLGIRVQW